MWNNASEKKKNSLEFSVANSEGNFIGVVLAAAAINTRETITSVEFKKQKAKELKEKWSEKQMHNSSWKRRKKLVRKKRDNGYQEET